MNVVVELLGVFEYGIDNGQCVCILVCCTIRLATAQSCISWFFSKKSFMFPEAQARQIGICRNRERRGAGRGGDGEGKGRRSRGQGEGE